MQQFWNVYTRKKILLFCREIFPINVFGTSPIFWLNWKRGNKFGVVYVNLALIPGSWTLNRLQMYIWNPGIPEVLYSVFVVVNGICMDAIG